MHRKLLIEAFDKAKKEQGFSKKTHAAEYLSSYIFEVSKEPYGEKILVIHYNKSVANSSENVELKRHAVSALCSYLGYEDFNDFNQPSNRKLKKNRNRRINKSNNIIILILIVLIITYAAYKSVNKQRWMIWQEDHYVEVKFDVEKYNLNQLKLYKEDRVESFKKIKPECKQTFFKKNGDPKIWYGKNAEGNLEYFTSIGLHPETGKTLKAITRYMINKYICD